MAGQDHHFTTGGDKATEKKEHAGGAHLTLTPFPRMPRDYYLSHTVRCISEV